MGKAVFLLAVSAWLIGQRQAQKRLLDEIAGLKDEVGALRSAASPILDESTSSPDPALMQEFVILRGEIAALRQELGERARVSASAEPGTSAPAPVAQGGAVPAFVKRGWVEAEGLPPTVLAAFREQLGNVPLEGANMKRAEGQLYFSVDTRLSDGRGVELTVNDQGQVVGRLLEMSLATLDAVVREQAMVEVGTVPVRRVAEVFEDGRTRYQVVAKDENQAVSVMLAPDGTVLRTEFERRGKKS